MTEVAIEKSSSTKTAATKTSTAKPPVKPVAAKKPASPPKVKISPLEETTPEPVPVLAKSKPTNTVLKAMMPVASQPISAPEAPAQAKSPHAVLVSEERLNVDLPLTMDFQPNVPGTNDGRCFEIRLYGEGCMDCKALVASAEETRTDCHFSAGNIYCPAGSMRVVFFGERMRLLQRIRKARSKGDTNRFLGLIGSLEDQDLDTKNFVLKELGMMD